MRVLQRTRKAVESEYRKKVEALRENRDVPSKGIYYSNREVFSLFLRLFLFLFFLFLSFFAFFLFARSYLCEGLASRQAVAARERVAVCALLSGHRGIPLPLHSGRGWTQGSRGRGTIPRQRSSW